jgi:DNA-binding response OmpR family regulator
LVRNENPSGAGFLVGCQFDALGDVARLELECFVSLKRESMREGAIPTRRVMMIGRDLPLAETLRKLLLEYDMELVVAPGAVDGFHSLRSLPPALVLAQWNMPDLDGAGICRVLHATHGLENFPVILFDGTPEDEVPAQLAGAARFFASGASPKEIVEGIRECVPRAQSSAKASVFQRP